MRQLKRIGFICNIFNCLNEKKIKGSQILLPRIGVLDCSLLVRQLKHKGFICNIFNCLNEENKRFTNSFSLFFFLSLLLFFFFFFLTCPHKGRGRGDSNL
jgi:hypothetical protein